MNILFLDWPCFGRSDILDFFSEQHHNVTLFSHPDYDRRESADFASKLDQIIEASTFDFCFSFNYFPLMARACHKHNLKYIAFVYDSPQVKLYSYTVTYPTNYIFLFDSSIVEQFRNNGISTFYYMPLPVNAQKIKSLLQQPYDRKRLCCDISFVGSLYNEEHNLYDSLKSISDHTLGYLDGLMCAQSKVYGASFMEDCLTPEILQELQQAAPYRKNPDGVETPSYIFSDYFLCRKLTSIERIDLLSSIADYFPLKIFTPQADVCIGNAMNMGSADYLTETPYIFHNSKININITLRSIKSGIPLRCMEILASEGFLLTNYQADFLRHFIPDEDFVYFESKEDMLQKIDYYLAHDNKRSAIAASGYEKVLKFHSYPVIFEQIYQIIN